MPESFVQFDHQMVENIESYKDTARRTKLDLMNNVADQVIANGGYCDDLTFSTAFFGGIDPGMNWGNDYTNERLAADEIPPEFNAALAIRKVLKYSVFQPFIAGQGLLGYRSIDDIGIIMPGSECFGNETVGFKIHRPENWHPDHYSYIGKLVFNGLSKQRDYRPLDEHCIFTVIRHQGSVGANNLWVDRDNVFGVAAVSEHVLGNHSFSARESAQLTNDLDRIREEAEQYAGSASPIRG